jgi:hypothetical protein
VVIEIDVPTVGKANEALGFMGEREQSFAERNRTSARFKNLMRGTLEHDPEKLQTFRIISCDQANT